MAPHSTLPILAVEASPSWPSNGCWWVARTSNIPREDLARWRQVQPRRSQAASSAQHHTNGYQEHVFVRFQLFEAFISRTASHSHEIDKRNTTPSPPSPGAASDHVINMARAIRHPKTKRARLVAMACRPCDLDPSPQLREKGGQRVPGPWRTTTLLPTGDFLALWALGVMNLLTMSSGERVWRHRGDQPSTLAHRTLLRRPSAPD